MIWRLSRGVGEGTAGPSVYANGTATPLTSPHINEGSATTTGSGHTVTVTLNPAFSSATSYACTVGGADGGEVTQSSGSSITITAGFGSNGTYTYICAGN